MHKKIINSQFLSHIRKLKSIYRAIVPVDTQIEILRYRDYENYKKNKTWI
jgi:hypothetical protein